MQGLLAGDDVTACEFRTAQDVSLWPIEIVSANYFSFAPDLPLNTFTGRPTYQGRYPNSTEDHRRPQVRADVHRPAEFLSGGTPMTSRTNCTSYAWPPAWVCLALRRKGIAMARVPAGDIRAAGRFADSGALLPVTLRSFQGYRLIQEYFAFPQRFRFFELTGLAPIVKRVDSNELELVILCSRGEAMLESVVDASNFALFCTPAVNLFPKRADRIQVSDNAYEYPRRSGSDATSRFRDLRSDQVVGQLGRRRERAAVFAVLLGLQHRRATQGLRVFHDAARAEARPPPRRGWRGTRSSYIGTRCFCPWSTLTRPRSARSSAALDPDAVHQSRSRVADAAGIGGRSDFSLISPRRSRASAS